MFSLIDLPPLIERRGHVFHYPKEWFGDDWVFIGFEHNDFRTLLNVSKSGWKTKRNGLNPITVYNDEGRIKLIREKYFPVFVSRKEYDEHQEMVKKLSENKTIEKIKKPILKRK